MYLFTESATSLLNFDEVEKANRQSAAAQSVNDLPLVLIADEDGDTRLMMRYLLNLWSYRVVEATDDNEAFQTAQNQRPDLILISDKFSSLDGLSTIRRIRELGELDRTVIIFINCYSTPSIQASALAVGADDFMTKPIDFGRLETKLEYYLKKDNQFKQRFFSENL